LCTVTYIYGNAGVLFSLNERIGRIDSVGERSFMLQSEVVTSAASCSIFFLLHSEPEDWE